MKGEHGGMGKKRILIVEDEAQTAVLLRRALDERLGPGHQISICPLAQLALSRLQEEQFDLIVTDICMPGISGLELVRRVRQSDPQQPLLVITAYGTPEIEEIVSRLGVAYLAKPFRLKEFIAAVESLLTTDRQENAQG